MTLFDATQYGVFLADLETQLFSALRFQFRLFLACIFTSSTNQPSGLKYTQFAITTSFNMVDLGRVFVTDKLGISITRCRSCIKEFRLQWRICDNKQRTMSIKIQMECVLMGEHTMLLAVYFDVRKCHSPHFMMTPGPALSRAFLATFCIHSASISLSCIFAMRNVCSEQSVEGTKSYVYKAYIQLTELTTQFSVKTFLSHCLLARVLFY